MFYLQICHFLIVQFLLLKFLLFQDIPEKLLAIGIRKTVTKDNSTQRSLNMPLMFTLLFRGITLKKLYFGCYVLLSSDSISK